MYFCCFFKGPQDLTKPEKATATAEVTCTQKQTSITEKQQRAKTVPQIRTRQKIMFLVNGSHSVVSLFPVIPTSVKRKKNRKQCISELR